MSTETDRGRQNKLESKKKQRWRAGGRGRKMKEERENLLTRPSRFVFQFFVSLSFIVNIANKICTWI